MPLALWQLYLFVSFREHTREPVDGWKFTAKLPQKFIKTADVARILSKGTSGAAHLDISNLNVASLNSTKRLLGMSQLHVIHISNTLFGCVCARFRPYWLCLVLLPFRDLHFIHLFWYRVGKFFKTSTLLACGMKPWNLLEIGTKALGDTQNCNFTFWFNAENAFL